MILITVFLTKKFVLFSFEKFSDFLINMSLKIEIFRLELLVSYESFLIKKRVGRYIAINIHPSKNGSLYLNLGEAIGFLYNKAFNDKM